MSEFPFYPTLPEGGGEQVQKLMDAFKEKMAKICDDTLGDLYTDISCHAETDHWTNYRNKLMDGFRNYSNRLVQGEHDFKAIRAEIFKDFREDIIKDLNQDLLDEVANLKETIESIQRIRR